jgi:O-antigen ligase
LLWKTDQILQGGGREAIYSLLWQIALDRPIWGIGLGRFVQINNLGWLGVGVYPHNNFLGIAAETGFIASLAYFFFVISSTYWGLRLIKRVKTRGNSLTGAVLFIPFSMLIYHQFRGLLQDTWTVKEVYLWVGVMAGISDRLAVLKYA